MSPHVEYSMTAQRSRSFAQAIQLHSSLYTHSISHTLCSGHTLLRTHILRTVFRTHTARSGHTLLRTHWTHRQKHERLESVHGRSSLHLQEAVERLVHGSLVLQQPAQQVKDHPIHNLHSAGLLAGLGIALVVLTVHFPEGPILLEQTTCERVWSVCVRPDKGTVVTSLGKGMQESTMTWRGLSCNMHNTCPHTFVWGGVVSECCCYCGPLNTNTVFRDKDS